MRGRSRSGAHLPVIPSTAAAADGAAGARAGVHERLCELDPRLGRVGTAGGAVGAEGENSDAEEDDARDDEPHGPARKPVAEEGHSAGFLLFVAVAPDVVVHALARTRRGGVAAHGGIRRSVLGGLVAARHGARLRLVALRALAPVAQHELEVVGHLGRRHALARVALHDRRRGRAAGGARHAVSDLQHDAAKRVEAALVGGRGLRLAV